jgi:DNA-binding NarL/FixJ family response regulator
MCPIAIGDGRRGALGLERTRQESVRSHKRATTPAATATVALAPSGPAVVSKIRTYVLAENELVREALFRVLSKNENLVVVVGQNDGGSDFGRPVGSSVDVLVLVSRENTQADLEQIAAIRKGAPGLKILLIGSAKEDSEFLPYVRAGISGYLWRDASSEDVARAIENVHAGRAVCPGELCAALFRFFEDAEPRLPFGSPTQRLGLTRREQQIVPLIAKGFTNKEIANHFCLSEQTVKNHLYRMKHKIGAEDRLSIVQKFRVHGLLL